MDRLILAFGAVENLTEDIHLLARKYVDSPVTLVVQDKDARAVMMEKASALFIEENLVVVLIDPQPKTIEDLQEQMGALRQRVHLIIYSTTHNKDLGRLLDVNPIVLEKERESRIKERVLGISRQYGKKITDKAFALLKNRIRDEAFLDTELMKLIDYVGERKTIESRDVSVTVSAGHEDTLIMLYDAISARQKREVSAILAHLLGQGLHVLAIHNFLIKQMRLLLHAKDTEVLFSRNSEYKLFSRIFSQMKDQVTFAPLDRKQYLPFQKPFYAYTLSKTSARFSAGELESFLSVLAAFDRSVKKGTRHEITRLESGIFGM